MEASHAVPGFKPGLILARLCLAVSSLFVSLAFCEGFLHLNLGEKLVMLPAVGVGARLSSFHLLYGGYEPHRILGYRGLPYSRVRFDLSFHHRYGMVSTNRGILGLNGNHHAIKKSSKSFRILVLGDSQTDGAGTLDTDEAFPNQLQRLLNKASPVDALRVEVLNAGVSGYSPWQYYLWHRLYAPALRPDLVVVGFYAGNDVLDLEQKEVRESAALYEAMEQDPFRLRFLWRLSETRSQVRARKPRADLRKVWSLAQKDRRKDPLISQSLAQNFLQKYHPESFLWDLLRIREILARLNEETVAARSRLVLLLIPSKWQVEPEDDHEMKSAMKQLGLFQADLTSEVRTEKALSAFFRRRGIPCLNAIHCLHEAHEHTGKEMFGHWNWHLSPAGAATVARALEDFLRAGGFIPRYRTRGR